MSWTSFVITHVERYQTSTTAAQSSPWAATTTGVAVLSAVGVVGLIAIVAGVAFAVYKYRFGGRYVITLGMIHNFLFFQFENIQKVQVTMWG